MFHKINSYKSLFFRINMKTLGQIKNKIVSDKKIFLFFLKLINFPLIGILYDSIYFRHIRKKVKTSDLTITIEPNNICNLECVMCPYQHMTRPKKTMSLELFKKIVDEARGLGVKDIHLTQYNEPFTDKLIFERLRYIRSRGLTSSFYSNATLLTDSLIAKTLKDPPNLLRFSVDGVNKKTFESIRKGANFELVKDNIKKLVMERDRQGLKLPRIEVFFTILDANIGEAKAFLQEWKNVCDFISVYPADSRESGNFVGLNYLKLKSYPCFQPKKVIVLSDGLVALCCVDIDGKIPLGDLNKQTLKEIFDSKIYKQTYESQMNRVCKLDLCKNCSKGCIDSAFSWWIY